MVTQRMNKNPQVHTDNKVGRRKTKLFITAECQLINVEGNLFITIIAIRDAGNNCQWMLNPQSQSWKKNRYFTSSSISLSLLFTKGKRALSTRETKGSKFPSPKLGKWTLCASWCHTEVRASLLQCSCQKCRPWIPSGGKSRHTTTEGQSAKQLSWTLQLNAVWDPCLVKGTWELSVLFLYLVCKVKVISRQKV